jgi:hypothetical protein
MSALRTSSPSRDSSPNKSSYLPGISSPAVIQHLQIEAADLRRKTTATRQLEDQIGHFQILLSAAANSQRFAEEEHRSQNDASVQFIATLRNEVEALRRQLGDRRQ